jgi:hypothetical protein
MRLFVMCLTVMLSIPAFAQTTAPSTKPATRPATRPTTRAATPKPTKMTPGLLAHVQADTLVKYEAFLEGYRNGRDEEHLLTALDGLPDSDLCFLDCAMRHDAGYGPVNAARKKVAEMRTKRTF